MPKTDTESKAVTASISMKPEHESNSAAASTVDVLEQELSAYAQGHKVLISSANDARNISDPDILMSLSKNLEKGADEKLDVAHKLIVAGECAVCASTEELVDSMYPNRI